MIYQKGQDGLLNVFNRLYNSRAMYCPLGYLLWDDGKMDWIEILEDEILMSPNIWGGINDPPVHQTSRVGKKWDHMNPDSIWDHESHKRVKLDPELVEKFKGLPGVYYDLDERVEELGPARYDVVRFGEYDHPPVHDTLVGASHLSWNDKFQQGILSEKR